MKLKEYRKLKGMTLKAMAESIGISIAYVHQLENEQKTPSLKTACSIKDATGGAVTLEDQIRH